MAQNYEIDIKRFNGQDYDTLLPTPASHASTHQAGGSDPITVKTGNIENSAVTTAKIANSAVTRAKLAQDAFISPIVTLAPTSSVKSADVGKTLRFASGNQDFVLNVVKDDQIPIGATYAIFRYAAKSNKIVFGDTVKVTFMGNSSLVVGPTFTIPESFGQIAIMKFASDNTYDYWHVSGPAEVIS